LKIALVSLNQKWEDKAWNLERCQFFVAKAAEQNADLVIFPEMTLTGFSFNTSDIAESASSSESVQAFGALARQHNIGIVAGVVLTAASGKCLNTLVAFSKDGQEEARYHKIHPFSFAGENAHFDSGNHLSSMDFCGFKLGFTICYDLRFPELFSALSKDCNLLINIANWPQKRIQHWDTLLQARAIENQVYMIGVNRIGEDANGLNYVPSSKIISPVGEIMEHKFFTEELSLVDVDLDLWLGYKKTFKTSPDRRVEFYKTIL
jgi:omega-amidase